MGLTIFDLMAVSPMIIPPTTLRVCPILLGNLNPPSLRNSIISSMNIISINGDRAIPDLDCIIGVINLIRISSELNFIKVKYIAEKDITKKTAMNLMNLTKLEIIVFS